jgi:hypothetical protein
LASLLQFAFYHQRAAHGAAANPVGTPFDPEQPAEGLRVYRVADPTGLVIGHWSLLIFHCSMLNVQCSMSNVPIMFHRRIQGKHKGRRDDMRQATEG